MGEGAKSIDRTLDLFAAIVDDNGATSIGALARRLSLPMSTAHRLVARLQAHGLVASIGRGRYGAGSMIARAAARFDHDRILASASRPHLRRLAKATGRTTHLGVLRDDMVTYLVKESVGVDDLFTRESMQLEAYASAVGKVLLAALPQADLDAYLSGDGFVPLTRRTITEPAALRRHLRQVREQGFALDEYEIADDLFCVAAPVRGRAGEVRAAISCAARAGAPEISIADLVGRLLETVARIEASGGLV
jgi:DNA-binding IclR family transcriptional regulator